MIARYTRPEMGRIWSDQNKFQQWLEVELAASEALAELGVVPAEAARLLRAARRLRRRAHPRNRERGEARRDRLHHRGGRDDGGGRARRSLALVSLRADVERRGGYGAGAAAAAGVGDPARRSRSSCAKCSSGAPWSSSTRCRSAARTECTPSRSPSASSSRSGTKRRAAIWTALRRRGRGPAGRQDLRRGGHVRPHRTRRPRS